MKWALTQGQGYGDQEVRFPWDRVGVSLPQANVGSANQNGSGMWLPLFLVLSGLH